MTHMLALSVRRRLAAAAILGSARRSRSRRRIAACSSTPPRRGRRSTPPHRRRTPPTRRRPRRPRRGDDRAPARALGGGALERPARLGRRPRRASSGPRCCAAATGRRPAWPAPARRRAAARATAGDDAALRDWMQRALQPYRVESLETATPAASPPATSSRWSRPRARRGRLSRRPPRPAGRPGDAASPYWTRQQIETLPAAQTRAARTRDRLGADPLDALVLQVQGSGRLRSTSERDGAPTLVRIAFAGHNDQPYGRSAAG